MRMIVALLVLSGCSVIFMDHESNYPRDREPRCSSSPLLPVADSAAGVLDGAVLAGLVKNHGDVPDMVAAGSSLAIDLLSAAIGFAWASSCDDARDAYDAWLRKHRRPEDQDTGSMVPPEPDER